MIMEKEMPLTGDTDTQPPHRGQELVRIIVKETINHTTTKAA
jgi:hypothetical protein